MALLQIRDPVAEAAKTVTKPGEAVIGIDLGTTNSLVAAVVGGRPRILKLKGEKSLVPSALAFKKGEKQPLVGAAAKASGRDDYLLITSIKRLMGRAPEELPRLGGKLPYKLAPGEADSNAVCLDVWGQRLSPVELSAFILKNLKARAEEVLSKAVKKAVITVPAYFDDAARLATKDAARLAGLEPMRLLNEPTAAALAYKLDRGNPKDGSLTAVYDLGGGTFDVSLLRFKQGVFQVIATGGDGALGGDDLDYAVAEHFLADLSSPALSIEQSGELLAACRLIREMLSERESAVAESPLGQLRLTRAGLEKLIEPIIAKTCAIATDVLEDAGVGPEQIANVVPVGGATRTPLVRRRIKEAFKAEPKTDLNPDEVVALGAAFQAEALGGSGKSSILLDVTPLSLGVETMGGLVSKLIDRNTPIPVAKAQSFTTYKDGQTALAIHVLQGEREMASQCRSLARFELRSIPPMAAGLAKIRITFTVDADGLLTVAATETSTGVRQQVEVKPSYGIGPDKMRKMLEESVTHAEEDAKARLLTETKVEARSLLERLRSALSEDGDLCNAEELNAIRSAEKALNDSLKKSGREAILERLAELERASAAFAEKRINRAVGEALKGKTVEDLRA